MFHLLGGLWGRMGSLAVTLVCCSLSEMGRVAGHIKLESVFVPSLEEGAATIIH